MKLMKFTRSAVALFALLLLAVACRQPPTPPDPSETGGVPQAGNGDVDWVSPEAVRRSDPGEVPPSRAEGFSNLPGDDGRLEGVLPSVYFAFDQSAVRPADRPALQEAADYLLQQPNAKLIIEGHCDWRGTSEYNLALGERRAASARDYLLSLGIPQSRVEIVSKGDLEAVETDDEGLLQQDRRADLVIIP